MDFSRDALAGSVSVFKLERFEKSCARVGKLFFKPLGAIAISTGPRLGAVMIAAATPIVGVLNLGQIKILLPVGLFFLKRSRAVAHLDPSSSAVLAHTRVFHIA